MKSFLQGRSVQGGAHLHASGGGGVEAMTKGRASSHGDAVQIEAVREGEKVVKLIVTCTCGQRIEIDCLYPPGH
jgi:hypothetical protein